MVTRGSPKPLLRVRVLLPLPWVGRLALCRRFTFLFWLKKQLQIHFCLRRFFFLLHKAPILVNKCISKCFFLHTIYSLHYQNQSKHAGSRRSRRSGHFSSLCLMINIAQKTISWKNKRDNHFCKENPQMKAVSIEVSKMESPPPDPKQGVKLLRHYSQRQGCLQFSNTPFHISLPSVLSR